MMSWGTFDLFLGFILLIIIDWIWLKPYLAISNIRILMTRRLDKTHAKTHNKRRRKIMSNQELLRQLRSITSAGMADCKKALEEANWDLEAAVDIVKVKGLQQTSAREGKVAAEGIVKVGWNTNNCYICVEINCQTDFVAQSQEFLSFANKVADELLLSTENE